LNYLGLPNYEVKNVAFGVSRNSIGTSPTDKLFTGQRLDSTGLYFYGARYYDPQIGRFISPDSIVPNPADPQSLNRYSYCLNNPLKYTDPTGHWPNWNTVLKVVLVVAVVALATALVVATVGAAAPAIAAAGGVIIGGSLTTGEIALISTSVGIYAGYEYAVNNSDASENLPASKSGTDSGGQTGNADPNQNPFNSKRDELLSKTQNGELKKAVNELYRPAKPGTMQFGDGGTADAIRWYRNTGELIDESTHIQKGFDQSIFLRKILQEQTLSYEDKTIAENLLRDLDDALMGLTYP
jgi:RHS repeat-associated protein